MTVQWPLVFFTLLVSLGAGVLFVTGLLSALGKDEKVRFPALATSIVSLGVGGCASVLHLQHFDRIFNGFGHLSSGITQELIFIVVAVVVIVVYFALARKGATPKWVGIVAMVAAVLLVAFMSHSYAMAARPAWDNVLMYAFYLGGSFLLGSTAIMAIAGFREDDTALSAKLSTIAGALQTVIVLAYGVFVGTLGSAYTSVGMYFDSTVPMEGMQDVAGTVSGFLGGENALLFWGGAVVLGAVAPLVAGAVSMKRPARQAGALGVVGVVCALVGGVAFRVILYNLGYSAFVIF